MLLRSSARYVVSNVGVKKHTYDFQIVCVTEMLADKKLVYTDLWGIKQAALEKERQKTTRIVHDSYNQFLVQYIHVHTQHLKWS